MQYRDAQQRDLEVKRGTAYDQKSGGLQDTYGNKRNGKNKRNVRLEEASDNVKNLVEEPNWDYAIIERMNKTDLSMQIIPFNLGELVLKKNPKENLPLQPGDIVTIFGKKDIQTPVRSARE
jgi:hypothetical protein